MAELIMARILALIFSALIFAQAYVIRSRQGTWLAPGAIFALYWGLMTAIPILAVQDVAPPAGTGVILIMVSLFSVGTSLVPARAVPAEPLRLQFYDTGFLKVALIATAIAALGCLAYNSTIQGISLDRAFSFEAAAEYTENRYSGDLISNIFLQMATLLSYVAAVLCGLMLGNAGRSRPLIILMGLAPTLFVLVTQSAKGALLLSGAFIAAGHFVHAIHAGDTRLVSRSALHRIFFYAALIFPLLIISFLARGLYGAVSPAELSFRLYSYLVSYSAGHLFAFNDWILYYFNYPATILYSIPDTAPGFFSFMSIARALGDVTPVPPGTYAEYYAHSDFLQTNIYTMFRGLITDFSFGGALIFMFASGIVAKLAFRSLTTRPFAPIAAVFYIIFVAATQQSAYVSLFQYNSPYVLGVALVILFSLNYAVWKSRERRAATSSPRQRLFVSTLR